MFADPLGDCVSAGSGALWKRSTAHALPRLPRLPKPKFFAMSTAQPCCWFFPFLWVSALCGKQVFLCGSHSFGTGASWNFHPARCLLPYVLSSISAKWLWPPSAPRCQRAASPALEPMGVEPPRRGLQFSGIPEIRTCVLDGGQRGVRGEAGSYHCCPLELGRRVDPRAWQEPLLADLEISK